MRKALLVLILALLVMQAAYIVYRNSRPSAPPAKVVKQADERKIDESRAKKRSPDEVGEEIIRGFVFDAAGNPAANCTVIVATMPPREDLVKEAPRSPRWFERTDKQGQFSVTELPPGSYTVLARTDRTHAVSQVTMREHGAPADVMLLLEESQTIRGEVVDEAQKPVPNATVFPLSDSGVHHPNAFKALPASTGADGRFMFTYLPRGKWTLLAVDKDLSAHNSGTFGGNGELSRIILPLGAIDSNTPRISGSLVSLEDERPLSRVKLELRETKFGLIRYTTLTDSAGVFDFGPVDDGKYTLTLDADRYALPEGVHTIRMDYGDEPLVIALKAGRAGKIRGRILDESERYGVEGVRVSAQAKQGNKVTVHGLYTSDQHFVETRSDTAGYYTLQGLAAGEYEVNAWTTPDQVSQPRDNKSPETIIVTPGTTHPGPAWIVGPPTGASVSGQVVDAQGQPVSNVGVRLRELMPEFSGILGPKRHFGWNWDTRTDSEGTFILEGIPTARPVQLRAEKLGIMSAIFGPEPIDDDGITNLTLTLDQPALGAIMGRVSHDDPGWQRSETVHCFADSVADGEESRSPLDTEGQFRFLALTPGPYRLVVGDKQLRLDLQPNEIMQDVEIRLP